MRAPYLGYSCYLSLTLTGSRRLVFPTLIICMHSWLTPFLLCKPHLSLFFCISRWEISVSMFTNQVLLFPAVNVPVCLSACRSITETLISHWFTAVCFPHTSVCCVSICLHVCLSLCQTDGWYRDRKWVLKTQKLTRCLLWATSFRRHWRSGEF